MSVFPPALPDQPGPLRAGFGDQSATLVAVQRLDVDPVRTMPPEFTPSPPQLVQLVPVLVKEPIDKETKRNRKCHTCYEENPLLLIRLHFQLPMHFSNLALHELRDRVCLLHVELLHSLQHFDFSLLRFLFCLEKLESRHSQVHLRLHLDQKLLGLVQKLTKLFGSSSEPEFLSRYLQPENLNSLPLKRCCVFERYGECAKESNHEECESDVHAHIENNAKVAWTLEDVQYEYDDQPTDNELHEREKSPRHGCEQHPKICEAKILQEEDKRFMGGPEPAKHSIHRRHRLRRSRCRRRICAISVHGAEFGDFPSASPSSR